MRKLQTCYLDNHVQDARKRNHKNRWNVIATVISLFFVIISVSNLYRVEAPSIPTKRSIENHSTIYTVFRGERSFSISRFRFFLVHRIDAINLRYIFEVYLFSFEKKKLYKYLYVYRMHTQLFSIATSLLLLLEKNIKKKKKRGWTKDEFKSCYIYIYKYIGAFDNCII